MLEHDSAKLGAGNLVDVNALTMNISYQGVILSLECNMDFVEEEAEILLRKEIWKSRKAFSLANFESLLTSQVQIVANTIAGNT